MVIYGVAILAGCYITGQFVGDYLGALLGIEANVGGVGFAMLLLILVNTFLHKKNLLPDQTSAGISFWSSMYLSIIVAMSAIQNVNAAITGGVAAVAAGGAATVICFFLVPAVAKLSRYTKE